MAENTVRRRSRHLSPYKDVGHKFHAGLDAFLSSDAEQAVHTVKHSGRVVDVLYESNGAAADTLVVSFPAAMTIRHRTFPYFNGRRAARGAGLPLLAFSDPAFAVSAEVLTGWTLGDSSYVFHRDVPTIIEKFRKGRRLIFTGISAGGFPALYFSQMFPDSLCFVVNPRTALLTPPTHLTFSAGVLFPGWSLEAIIDAVPTSLGRASNTVLYAQNIRDDRYFSSQMLPYFAVNEANQSLFGLLGDWGEGHVPMEPREYSDLLGQLASADEWSNAISAVGGRRSAL